MLAHVRAASPGMPILYTNCHPFRSGQFAFMHNGAVPSFKKLRRALQQNLSDEVFCGIEGTTDSEHIFAMILNEMTRVERSSEQPLGPARLSEVVKRVVQALCALMKQHGVQEAASLNMVVCLWFVVELMNSQALLAVRWMFAVFPASTLCRH